MVHCGGKAGRVRRKWDCARRMRSGKFESARTLCKNFKECGTLGFWVQRPYSSCVEERASPSMAYSRLPPPPAGPSTSTINYNGPQYGYDTTATYLVYTFPGEQLLRSGYDSMTVSETVSGCSGCETGAGGTNANSNVVDDLHALSSQPLPPDFSITATQTISVGGFLVRNNTLKYTAQGVTITNNGPTQ